MKKTKRISIPIGKIDRDVLNRAITGPNDCSISLIHRKKLIGSGTLIRWGDKYGILTAYHVPHNKAHPFNFAPHSGDELGLLIDSREHFIGIPMYYLICHDIAVPKSPARGPDLAVLELLLGNELSMLKAKKTFFDLTAHTKHKLQFCKDRRNGIWAISHSIAEYSKRNNFDNGTTKISVQCGITYTTPYRIYHKDGYDYVEVGMSYMNMNKLPNTFGGGSGGGLWKFPMEVTEIEGKRNYKIGNPALAGVIFYQTSLNNDYRRIRCHGPESVYKVLLEKLNN
ncbi:MAG: hypothetical protein QME64_13110 [bacterium]|nr:hypothetical protein [bacterium]